MSLNKLSCTLAFCAILAAPVMAQPTVSVDLVRKANGTPLLNSAGNFQYRVSVDPDETLFAAPGTGAENAGIVGGSVGLEAGYTLSLSANDATSTFTGPLVLSATKGAAFTAANTDNFGATVFGWDAGLDGLEISGADNQAVSFIGSLFLTEMGTTPNVGFEMDATGRVTAAIIEAKGPQTSAATGGSVLSTRLVASGSYSGNGRVAQAGQNFDNVSSTVQFRTLPGDANLDGVTNIGDFSVLQNNFNQPGTWATGNFNGDANTNIGDFSIIQNNFNQTAPAPFAGATASVVPEPSTLAIVGLMACGGAATLLRRKRQS